MHGLNIPPLAVTPRWCRRTRFWGCGAPAVSSSALGACGVLTEPERAEGSPGPQSQSTCPQDCWGQTLGGRERSKSREGHQTLFEHHIHPLLYNAISMICPNPKWPNRRRLRSSFRSWAVVTLSCHLLLLLRSFLWGSLKSNAVQSLLTFPISHLLLHKPGGQQEILLYVVYI